MRVSYEVRVNYEVIGEGSFEGCCVVMVSGEWSCQGHFVVKVEVDHSEGVVEVD